MQEYGGIATKAFMPDSIVSNLRPQSSLKFTHQTNVQMKNELQSKTASAVVFNWFLYILYHLLLHITANIWI